MDDSFVGVSFIISWVVFCIFAGVIAKNKGRSGLGFFFLAFFTSPLVGIIAALVSKPNTSKMEQEYILSGKSKKCPYCAEIIKAEAKICRFCQKEPIYSNSMKETRKEVSADGVITDGQTKLEWVVGPDQDTNYAQAEQWVASCKVAGGGWRMPTRVELKTLYRPGIGERNMDPAFKTTGWYVWAEPRDSSLAWFFNFRNGFEDWLNRDYSYGSRVFGGAVASAMMMS